MKMISNFAQKVVAMSQSTFDFKDRQMTLTVVFVSKQRETWLNKFKWRRKTLHVCCITNWFLLCRTRVRIIMLCWLEFDEWLIVAKYCEIHFKNRIFLPESRWNFKKYFAMNFKSEKTWNDIRCATHSSRKFQKENPLTCLNWSCSKDFRFIQKLHSKPVQFIPQNLVQIR